MPIDVHAHYVPRELLDAVQTRGAELGVTLLPNASGGPPALGFDYGFKVRPLFPKLVETGAERRKSLERQRLDRQLVATWPDIYGYGLDSQRCAAWHRILNDTLAAWCQDNADRFSFVASAPLTDQKDAAEELTRAATAGAVAAMIPANVEGANIGDLQLDEFWACAERLKLPVILHPVTTTPAPRAAKYGLMQIVQYTSDTTFGIGSLLAAGVFDRYPDLQIVLSHGGGTLPYLLGRFDVMFDRMDRQAQSVSATRSPSDYAARFVYDTIVHAPKTLRFLSDVVGLGQMVLGTDESFPPADRDPLGSLKAAGFSRAEIEQIADINPRAIFPALA